MANIYLELLEEFEPTGLSSRKSLSPFMESHFKKPPLSDVDTWYRNNADAQLFLSNVSHTGHFSFDDSETYHIGYNHTTGEYRWYDIVNIHARITIEGLEYLEKHKTNQIITDNSTHQIKTLDKQTAILREQTTILGNQRKYLYLTAFLTACTLGIAFFNFISDNSKTQLKQQLQEQTKQIHTLQIELSQAMNLHFEELKAKKTSPKKTGG